MDSVEEDYFNGDEVEEVPVEVIPPEELNIEKPFEVKRRRCVEDDGDDELLQLAQRSPRLRGIHPPLPSLTSESPDTSSGPNSSSSPPSSSPPSEQVLREKRPRDSDEQEDEIDRISRKRVVSPTDVKQKPSRGALNGGRKITISLGKK
jgi:hypothetical protein